MYWVFNEKQLDELIVKLYQENETSGVPHTQNLYQCFVLYETFHSKVSDEISYGG